MPQVAAAAATAQITSRRSGDGEHHE